MNFPGLRTGEMGMSTDRGPDPDRAQDMALERSQEQRLLLR